MNAETGIINIRGKQYQTVALRVQHFRHDHPDWSLTSDMIERSEDCVVMRAMIANDQGRVLATGFAEEYRKSSQINKTSALENAETSAIGRALAALGYGGTEYATANEVQNAIHQQGADEGHSQNGAVSPPASMPDAEYNKLIHLVEATGANTAAMLKFLKIKVQNDNLRLLNQEQYGRVLEALNTKLAAKAKAETAAKAKEAA